MARGQRAFRNHFLHRRREREQSQGVRDGGSVLPYPLADLLLGQSELLDELPVAVRLLQRSEILALQVLHQRDHQHLLVGQLAHDDRRGLTLQPFQGSPPTLAGHDLPPGARRTHDQWLQQAILPDRLRQLVEPGAREPRSGLERVRGDRGERYLPLRSALGLFQVFLQQGPEPFSESCVRLSHARIPLSPRRHAR